MCRNIRALCNLDPLATDAEIREASLQFVRKISGFRRPSRANEATFASAVSGIAAESRRLLDSLVTAAEPRDREHEVKRARALATNRHPSRPSTQE
jgi:hypothetical protein